MFFFIWNKLFKILQTIPLSSHRIPKPNLFRTFIIVKVPVLCMITYFKKITSLLVHLHIPRLLQFVYIIQLKINMVTIKALDMSQTNYILCFDTVKELLIYRTDYVLIITNCFGVEHVFISYSGYCKRNKNEFLSLGLSIR